MREHLMSSYMSLFKILNKLFHRYTNLWESPIVLDIHLCGKELCGREYICTFNSYNIFHCIFNTGVLFATICYIQTRVRQVTCNVSLMTFQWKKLEDGFLRTGITDHLELLPKKSFYCLPLLIHFFLLRSPEGRGRKERMGEYTKHKTSVERKKHWLKGYSCILNSFCDLT